MKKSTGLTPSFKKSARVTSESTAQDLENIAPERRSSARESEKKVLFGGRNKGTKETPSKMLANSFSSMAVRTPSKGRIDHQQSRAGSKSPARRATPGRNTTVKPTIHKDEERSSGEELSIDESEEEKVSEDSDDGEMECPECGMYTTNSESSMTRHRKTQHRIDEIEKAKDPKRVAHKVIDKRKTRSIMNKEPREEDLKCPECEYGTSIALTFSHHLWRKHRISPRAAGFALRCGCGHSLSKAHIDSCCKMKGSYSAVRRAVSNYKKKCFFSPCLACPSTIRGHFAHLSFRHGTTPKKHGVRFFCESCDCEVDSEKQARMHTSKCGGTHFSIVSTREKETEENGGEAVESDDSSSEEEEEYGEEREGGEVEYEVPPLDEIGEGVSEIEEDEQEEKPFLCKHGLQLQQLHPLHGLAAAALRIAESALLVFSFTPTGRREEDSELFLGFYTELLSERIMHTLFGNDPTYCCICFDEVEQLLKWFESDEGADDIIQWLEIIISSTRGISPNETEALSTATADLRAAVELAKA